MYGSWIGAQRLPLLITLVVVSVGLLPHTFRHHAYGLFPCDCHLSRLLWSPVRGLGSEYVVITIRDALYVITRYVAPDPTLRV